MAAGLQLPAGNVNCPRCRAEWDYNLNAQTLELLRSETPLPSWAQGWKGAVSIEKWYLAAGGKKSGNPGWLCPKCHTEFDVEDGGMLRLMTASSSTLQRDTNRVLTLGDWQRRGQGLPTEEEAQRLRADLQRLQSLRQNDQVQWQNNERTRKRQMQVEWDDLLKRSIIAGYIPFRRLSGRSPATNGNHAYVSLRDDNNRLQLRASEELRWETAANAWSAAAVPQISWQGFYLENQWNLFGAGTLTVTSDRVLFNAWRNGGAPWQCNVQQISKIETQLVQDVMLVVLTLQNSTVIGFDVTGARLEVAFDGKLYEVALSPLHLESVLKSVKG
jgi:hypothetical protein